MIAVADRRLVLPPNLAVPLTPWIVLARSAVPASCPVDITEDVLATINIPAGAMGPNGILRVTALWTITSSANSKTLRTRFSAAAGTQYVNQAFTAVASVKSLAQIANRNSNTSQVGDGQTFSSGSATTLAATTSAVDTTAATSIVISGQKALNTETITLESYLVELAYGA